MIPFLCVIAVCLTTLAGTWMVLCNTEPDITTAQIRNLRNDLIDRVEMLEERVNEIERKESAKETAETLKEAFKLK